MPNFIKNFCVLLLSPLALLWFAVIAALIWPRRRKGWRFVACVIVLLFGYPWVPNRMKASLTSRHEPVMVPDARILQVVVLAAGGFSSDAEYPANHRIGGDYLHRMMEGVRLHRALPGSQLFVSVSRPNDPAEARRCLMELAVLTGLSSDQVEPIVGASTTKDEARLARERIGTNEFYLVTSDWHMPRALLLFRQAGMNPIPAPAKEGGWARDGSFRASHLLPSAGNFQTTEQVMHEFLGLMWGEMRGARCGNLLGPRSGRNGEKRERDH